jgi:hypothetical protein
MELAVDHRTPSLSAPPSRPEAGRSDRSQQSDALRDVLAELGERVKPITLARERTLPVAAPFDQLLPDEGLVRGRVLSCRGVADTSLAFGLIAEALVEGAWAAMVDVATFGADAASEFGIPLERIVRVESGVTEAEQSAGVGAVASWIDVMGAAIDGFDVVVTKVPAELLSDRQHSERRPAAVRKLATRVQQKGSIVIVLGETGALSSDLVFSTDSTEWSGVTHGAGHLQSRVIAVAAGGRRLPAARAVSLIVDAASGRAVCSLAPTPAADLMIDLAADSTGERDPQAELLVEMTDNLDVTDTVSSGDHRLAG